MANAHGHSLPLNLIEPADGHSMGDWGMGEQELEQKMCGNNWTLRYAKIEYLDGWIWGNLKINIILFYANFGLGQANVGEGWISSYFSEYPNNTVLGHVHNFANINFYFK